MLLAIAVLAIACRQPAPAAKPVAAAVPAPAPEAILARIDLSDVQLGHVRDRLALVPATTPKDAAVVQALVEAAADLLVVREMAVLKELPRPGERPFQTANRFLAGVWRADAGCQLDPRDLKWTYMRDLGRYKHPASFTVWDAQFQCCPDIEHCPLLPSEACRKAVRPEVERLASEVRNAFAKLPSIGLAAEASAVTQNASPLQARHVPIFESLVAAAAVREPRLKLRRYTFYAQGIKGFEDAHFQIGEPAIAAAVAKAKLGDVLGPIDTDWGLDVVLLVARAPTRAGLLDNAVDAEVRAQACEDIATVQRVDYRQRLVAGARLEWRKDAILKAFGADVVKKLPPDATSRELPHLSP